MSNVVNRRDGFITDLMRMIAQGSSNDVKIILEDGEIYANKDVLTTRCEYFATCFSNSEFVEGETKTVTFSHCSKLIMEKIIHYLFSGDMKLHDLTLADLLKMMNMTRMMMIDDLLSDIQRFASNYIQDSGVNSGFLPELINSLILAEQFKLDVIKDELLLELYRSLKDVPNIPDVVLNSEAFKTLPFKLVNDVLLYGERVLVFGANRDDIPSTKHRFDSFVFWLTKNECGPNDKERITDSFRFECFTLEDLLTDVKMSRLYSNQRIDARVLEIHQKKKQEIEEKDREIEEYDRDIDDKVQEIEDKDQEIAEKDQEILEKDRELLEKDLHILGNVQEIEKKDQEIKKKDREIEEKGQEIARKNSLISSYALALNEKEAMIQSQGASLIQLRNILTLRDHELAQFRSCFFR